MTAPELLAELNRVLAYPKLQRYYTDEERTRSVALILALSEVVDLPISSEAEASIPRISRDPDDGLVIACAVAGTADLVVREAQRGDGGLAV